MVYGLWFMVYGLGLRVPQGLGLGLIGGAGCAHSESGSRGRHVVKLYTPVQYAKLSGAES